MAANRRCLLRLLAVFLLLTAEQLAPVVIAQPKESVIGGDGEILLCMPLSRFLEGPGKLFTAQTHWDDPQLKGTIVYTRPDFWRGSDYTLTVPLATAFVRERLVAIVREARTNSPSERRVYDDLKERLIATYDVPRQEDSRVVFLGPLSWWLILQDAQGNRIILERTAPAFQLSETVRLSYLAASFPPPSFVPLERQALCGVPPGS